MQIAREIESLARAEELLATSLRLVAARHVSDAEIRDTARLLASWSDEHVERLRALRSRFGRLRTRDADRVGRGLLRGLRLAGMGLLRDLEDLFVLAARASVGWIALGQAAKALRDPELETVCLEASATTKRQVAWVETHVKHIAPQALVVKADKVSEVRASLPPVRPAALVGAALGASLLAATLITGQRDVRRRLALIALVALGVRRLGRALQADPRGRAAAHNAAGGLPSLQPAVSTRCDEVL